MKNGEVTKEYSNHYIKAKKLGLPKPEFSKEALDKISKSAKGRIWTNEMRENHSKVMCEVAKNNPESYSANNVCGRSKSIEYVDSFGNNILLNNKWEESFAEYLNDNNILWTNIIEESLLYMWKNKERRYYPDFYLTEYDIYIEVKGYEWERDKYKWAIPSLKNRHLVIRDSEMVTIKLVYQIKNNFNFIIE